MEQVLVTPVVAVRLEHFIVAPSFYCLLRCMLSISTLVRMNSAVIVRMLIVG